MGNIRKGDGMQELLGTIRPHLPVKWTPSYQWYSPKQQRLFAELAGGLAIALSKKWFWNDETAQIKHYKQALVDAYTEDLCNHVDDLTSQWGYESRRFYAGEYGYILRYYSGKNTQTRVPFERTSAGIEYTYHLLADYDQRIPPAAMRAMARLEAAGFEPDEYRVATLAASYRIEDPLLCAQFGRWIISIAMWE